MKSIEVAVVSGHREKYKSLLTKIEKDGFKFSYFEQPIEFLSEKDAKDYDLILLDEPSYLTINKDGKFADLTDSYNVLLHVNEEDWEGSENFYKNGGWMLAEGKDADDKVNYYIRQMVTIENEIVPSIRKKNLFVGDLATYSLHELLSSAFLSRKSFEVFIVTERKSGRIFVENGKIVKASFGKSQDQEAVLRMLLLKHGKMRVVIPRRELTISTETSTIISIIHEYLFQKMFVDNWLSERAGFTIESAKFSWKSDNSYIFQSHYEKQLVQNMAKPLSFNDMVDIVDVPPLTLVEILNYLDESGNLIIESEAEERKSEYDVLIANSNWLKSKLDIPDEKKSAQILCVGFLSSGLMEFTSLLKGKSIKAKSKQNLEFMQFDFKDGFQLNVFALAIQDNIQSVIEMLGPRVNALLYFVDCKSPDKFEYLNYLIQTFQMQLEKSMLAVLTGINGLSEEAIDRIKAKFPVSAKVKFFPADLSALQQPLSILKEMEPYQEEEIQEESEE